MKVFLCVLLKGNGVHFSSCKFEAPDVNTYAISMNAIMSCKKRHKNNFCGTPKELVIRFLKTRTTVL